MLVKQKPILINGVEHTPADRDASAILVHIELCETNEEFAALMNNLSETEYTRLPMSVRLANYQNFDFTA